MRRAVWMVASVLAAALTVGPAHAAGAATSAAACAPPPGGSQGLLPVVETVAGASPGLADSRIRWTRWNSLITYGDHAVLAGQVVADGGAVPSARVDLYERAVGTRGWELVASARSDADTGVFEFGCLAPDPSTDYRAVFDGDLVHRETSDRRRIRVARAVSDRMRQVSSYAFRLAGDVRPHQQGVRVLLQARTCRRCAWRATDRDLTNRRSAWSFRIDAGEFTGRRWFRAMVPAGDGYVRSPGQRVWTITTR